MRSLLYLLVGAMTFSAASSALTKRQSTNYVYDGSFEKVRDRVASSFVFNVRAGGWLVRNRAVFDLAFPDGTAEDGRKDVTFFSSGPSSTRGSVSQNLTGLPATALTLSYYYKNQFNRHDGCTFTATLNNQVLDSFPVPLTEESSGWIQRTESFTPAQSSGEIKFELLCPRTTRHQYWEFYIDNISLTDAA